MIKWQATFLLLHLCTTVLTASAQSSPEAPLPDVGVLIQQTIMQQRFAESKERNYVFREDTNDIRLRKECTWAPQCPGRPTRSKPVGVAYHVVSYAEHHFEIFWLDGVRVARVLPSCDGCAQIPGEPFVRYIPVSESELAKENQRLDKEIAEAKALRAKGENPSSPDDPPRILLSRMLELCTFSNPRRQIADSRSTVLLDFVWNPLTKPANFHEAILKAFSGTIGIDEEDHAVQQVEGRFVADVELDGGNVKIRKGTRVTITNTRVNQGIWLLSRLDARGEAHYFAFAIDGDGYVFAGQYRQFHVDSRVLPGLTEIPADSPAPPESNLPQSPIPH